MKLIAYLSLLISVISRTLVLFDHADQIDSYSKFIASLQARGHQLEYAYKTNPAVPLIEYEERVYDHLLILSPLYSFMGALKMGQLLDFVNLGGNVLLAGSSNISEPLRDFAYEFSVDFSSTLVDDHFHQVGDGVYSSKIIGSSYIVSGVSRPIVYSGISHSISGRNQLAHPVLVAEDSAFGDNNAVGSKLNLVSAFQALNNARVIFCGSAALFTDKSFVEEIKVGDTSLSSGNEDFANQISEWVFNEKSVLKVKSKQHHRQGERNQHGIYRIKDLMVIINNKVYELQLLKLRDKKWTSFTPDDVQFEAVMLDPYIRRTMTKSGNNLTVSFKFPDQYGVFTLKVDYKRHGLTFIKLDEQVQVRPFRHDQYPRFLVQANPYYINIFGMMVGFFVFSAIFLFHKDTLPKVKTE